MKMRTIKLIYAYSLCKDFFRDETQHDLVLGYLIFGATLSCKKKKKGTCFFVNYFPIFLFTFLVTEKKLSFAITM